MTVRTEEELESALNRNDEHGESKFPGMSYEQGIAYALSFAIGGITEEELFEG